MPSNLTQADKHATELLLTWHLRRRRQMYDWPLDFEQTKRLYIPPAALEHMEKLKQLDHDSTKRIFCIWVKVAGTSVQISHKGQGLPVHSKTKREASVVNTFDYVGDRGGPRSAAFEEWVAAAREEDKVCVQLINAWRALLDEAKTWPQVYKAFPTAIEPLLGAVGATTALEAYQIGEVHRIGRRFSDSYYYCKKHFDDLAPRLREVWAEFGRRNPQLLRAAELSQPLAEMIDEVTEKLGLWCVQASLMPAVPSTADNPFAGTWIDQKETTDG